MRPKSRQTYTDMLRVARCSTMLRLMKAGSILYLCVLSLVSGLMGGCASSGSGPAAADAAAQKKGHWVTLPPQTGSHIPQRIWVDDSGQVSGSSSVNNVQTGSPAAVQRMQNNAGGPKPPGS